MGWWRIGGGLFDRLDDQEGYLRTNRDLQYLLSMDVSLDSGPGCPG